MKILKHLLILLLLVSCSKEETKTDLINTYLYNDLEFKEGYNPNKIEGIPPSMYESYYFEDFEKGANGWEETNFINETSYYKAEKGAYKMRHDVEGYVRFNNLVKNRPVEPLKIDFDSFEAKINFRYINDKSNKLINDNSKFGFIFGSIGSKTISNYISIGIDKTNTHTTLGGYYDGRNWKTLSKKPTSSLNFNELNELQSTQNVLVFRIINREIYVFLNGELVNYYIQNKFIKGDYFGFLVSNVNVAIEEIEIKKIIKQ